LISFPGEGGKYFSLSLAFAGLPDALFSDQKAELRYIVESLAM
jgi:hypothetical protein